MHQTCHFVKNTTIFLVADTAPPQWRRGTLTPLSALNCEPPILKCCVCLWLQRPETVQDWARSAVVPRRTATAAAGGAAACGQPAAVTERRRPWTSPATDQPAVSRTPTRRHAAVLAPTRPLDCFLSVVTTTGCDRSAAGDRVGRSAAVRQTSDTAVGRYVGNFLRHQVWRRV